MKSNDGLVTFGVYFGILKPKQAHFKEKRWRRRDNIIIIRAYSNIIIYRYFTIVATNSVHI